MSKTLSRGVNVLAGRSPPEADEGLGIICVIRYSVGSSECEKNRDETNHNSEPGLGGVRRVPSLP